MATKIQWIIIIKMESKGNWRQTVTMQNPMVSQWYVLVVRTREVRVCVGDKQYSYDILFFHIFGVGLMPKENLLFEIDICVRAKNCDVQMKPNSVVFFVFRFAVRRNSNNPMERSAQMDTQRMRAVSTLPSALVNERKNWKIHSRQSHCSPPASHT